MPKDEFENRLNDLFGFGGRVKVSRTRPTNERARTARERDRHGEAAKNERRERFASKRGVV